MGIIVQAGLLFLSKRMKINFSMVIVALLCVFVTCRQQIILNKGIVKYKDKSFSPL